MIIKSTGVRMRFRDVRGDRTRSWPRRNWTCRARANARSIRMCDSRIDALWKQMTLLQRIVKRDLDEEHDTPQLELRPAANDSSPPYVGTGVCSSSQGCSSEECVPGAGIRGMKHVIIWKSLPYKTRENVERLTRFPFPKSPAAVPVDGRLALGFQNPCRLMQWEENKTLKLSHCPEGLYTLSQVFPVTFAIGPLTYARTWHTVAPHFLVSD
ncbi:hypothetical protein BDZ89DRAFT_1113779 [Hymenopellis radicata]|nr:hypothetical protein BDZ89DRAFT_1113779 [Hymenopellis radicata]